MALLTAVRSFRTWVFITSMMVMMWKHAKGTVVADAVGLAPALATGGGQSLHESEPRYQRRVQRSGYRTTPDVVFDGGSNSGVTCFQNGRVQFGYFGTSLASPCWAGLIAIADQGRVANGGKTFNGGVKSQQALRALYQLPASDFHQIISGYNGHSAGVGYNEVTGLGSPVANILLPDLAAWRLPARVVDGGGLAGGGGGGGGGGLWALEMPEHAPR